MACNNAWANHRLLAARTRPTPAEIEAPRRSFSVGDAPQRVAEFATLRWSEATVWDGETRGEE
jgi:hypothetical protein